MKASFAELVAEAGARSGAVGAFTCYNLETAAGVLLAAEEGGRGVVLLVSRQSFEARGGNLLGAALVAASERAAVPACVQLDHVSNLDEIEAAFDLGFGAVLADGSALPCEDNVALVERAVRVAARAGGHVEAELGGIAGDEDVAQAAAAAGALTDAEQAQEFVELTGAACLAVSIGNVHGAYGQTPDLDWARLDAIRARVACPLSLHGASGLPNSDLHRAIVGGIAKVNVNTELRQRYLAVTEAELERARDGARVLELNHAQRDAVAVAVAEKLAAFEGRDPKGLCR
jgi:ketose-bisphosphate aldolase